MWKTIFTSTGILCLPVPTFFLFLHDYWVPSEGHAFAVTKAVWGVCAGLFSGETKAGGWMVPSQTCGAWELPNAFLRIRDFMQSQAYCFSCWLLEALSLGEGSPAKTFPLNLANLPGAGMVSWMMSPESTAEKWNLPDTGGRVLSFTWGRSKTLFLRYNFNTLQTQPL